MTETVLTNARLVLPDGVLRGTLVLRGAVIVEVQQGRSALPCAIDCDGDHLLPGIVDLHTDNLERQVQPRAGARWPGRSALVAHDAQCAAAGVTTVFDALCLGDLGFDPGRAQTCRDGVADLDALADTGLLRAEHLLHLRCELPAPDMQPALAEFADHARVRMASLMDHSPGIGQYRDLARFRRLPRHAGQSATEIEAGIARMLDQRARWREGNRAYVLARLRPRGLPLASHDDDDAAEIARNQADGIAISEFPVTLDAARAARAVGAAIIAGAPNIVRGGSHSGNVAAMDLVRAELCDALASDYVPQSPLEAAWRIARDGAAALPAAVALVTRNAAAMVGLHDRGALEAGLLADAVRVAEHAGQPIVRRVWRRGTIVS